MRLNPKEKKCLFKEAKQKQTEREIESFEEKNICCLSDATGKIKSRVEETEQ